MTLMPSFVQGIPPTKTGAALKRGRSKQTVETPQDFIDAVIKKFGPLVLDLAGSEKNKKAPLVYTKKENSLKQDWCLTKGLLWLNPPFDPISPWAEKCAKESRRGAEILLLSRASVDSSWYWNYVFPYATSYCLLPRIKFVGHYHTFPAPLMLSHYCEGAGKEALRLWRWVPLKKLDKST